MSRNGNGAERPPAKGKDEAMNAKEAAAVNGFARRVYNNEGLCQLFALREPEFIFVRVDENDEIFFQQIPSTPALLDLNDWEPCPEELPKRCRGPRGRKRAA
jgi:hypothetical protein